MAEDRTHLSANFTNILSAAINVYLCLHIFLTGLCFAAEITSDPIEQLNTIENVTAKINQINDRLTTLSAVKSDQVAQEFGVSTEDFDKRLTDLRMLRSAHERLLYSITALDTAEKEVLSEIGRASCRERV